MQTIGAWLKSAREVRALSLEEISRATKINLLFLRLLEEDQFDRLPGGMFPRAMVRSYTRTLGAGEETAMEIYDVQFPPPPAPPEPPPRNWKPVLRFVVFLTLCVLVAASGFFYLKNESAGGSLVQPQANDTRTTATTIGISAANVPVPVEATEPEPAAGLNLKILVLDECWLSLSADGNIIDRRLLKKGEAFSYHAENHFEALVGNAGGLKFVINGQVWENLGNHYRVIKIRIDNEDGKVRLTT
ncbi:MAG: DUF4115 domain-containing protein [Acidobacteria bacterium]|nr:DUF4115 domain-containing protein [Acidobacteriota bacterium]